MTDDVEETRIFLCMVKSGASDFVEHVQRYVCIYYSSINHLSISPTT